MDIANKIEDGVQTYEILQEMKKEKQQDYRSIRNKMLRGQLNARFGVQKGI